MKKIQNLLFVCLMIFQANVNGQIVVSTISGSVRGFLNGSTDDALFAFPTYTVFDKNGNMYISDSGNKLIRKISNDDIVSTFAGTVDGYQDGPIAIAKFSSPKELVVDDEGNVFVVDWTNHCIRKITKDGIVSTFAGTNIQGDQDGVGTNARFSFPYGLCQDSKGNLIVADNGNNKIKKISPSGVVTTIAGSIYGYMDAKGINAKFKGPSGLAIDKNDNIYVADFGNEKIRKIDDEGNVITLVNDIFDGILDLDVDEEGNVYAGCYYTIKKISKSGAVTTFAGSGARGFKDGPPLEAQFDLVSGVCVHNKDLIIADALNNSIRKIGEKDQLATQETDKQVLVYPNPTNNSIYVKTDDRLGQGKISIYNARGEKIKCVVCENLNDCEVNLSDEPTGLYLIKVNLAKDHKLIQDAKIVKI